MVYPRWRRYHEPARFFQEIPTELVQFENLGGMRRPALSRLSSSIHDQDVPIIDDFASDGEGHWVGLKVSHPDYGIGTIVAKDGDGPSAKVTIQFRGRLKRKFLQRFVEKYIG